MTVEEIAAYVPALEEAIGEMVAAGFSDVEIAEAFEEVMRKAFGHGRGSM